MTQERFFSVVRENGVMVMTIERPGSMNALPPQASVEMSRAFDEFDADPDVHVAIITGSGDRAFCAGNDLKFQAALGTTVTLPPTGFAGLTGRFNLNKPVIAAVNGLALGGGFEIVLACDLVVAAEHAEFALPEARVGLMAAAGGLLRLPRMVPPKQAMDLILTGRRASAAEGLAMGFVNEVVPAPAKVLDVARQWAERILQAAPLSIRASKDLVSRSLYGAEDLATLYPQQKHFPAAQALYASADAVEGPKAFAEKRAPRWTGR